MHGIGIRYRIAPQQESERHPEDGAIDDQPREKMRGEGVMADLRLVLEAPC